MPPSGLFRRVILNVPAKINNRKFSSSVVSRFDFVGPIELTAQLFRSLHDVTGLTYGVSIPLTAIALRTLVTLPLAVYSQKKLNRRIELLPLFYHWAEVIGAQTAARYRSQNLKTDKATLAQAMSKLQAQVFRFLLLSLTTALKTNERYIQKAWMH
jgi:membrane protein insertase Oxa1/YidC/SpoIIIJ